jgi:hypothetical protein
MSGVTGRRWWPALASLGTNRMRAGGGLQVLFVWFRRIVQDKKFRLENLGRHWLTEKEALHFVAIQ